MRFKQIISNLLGNAIKFTAKGEVRLILVMKPADEAHHVAICLRVEDTGMGISDQDQYCLFRPFVQASNNNQSARSGSGLGLVISRTLCEMMGGALNLSSTLGVGTQVEVTLQMPQLEPEEKPVVVEQEEQAYTPSLSILVVDDYPANRIVLSQQLSYLGHRVTDAENGALGLAAWRRGAFDVVITDCTMPVMNGYELARAVRAEEQALALTPCLIVGFTANAQPEEIDHCKAAGMDQCLFKPIGLKALSVCLASVLPDAKSGAGINEPTDENGEIDLSYLKQLSQDDDGWVHKVLAELALSNSQDLMRLVELFVNDDYQGLATLAHGIKGGGRLIQANELVECCEQLEAACRNGDSQRLTACVDALHSRMEHLGELLAKSAME